VARHWATSPAKLQSWITHLWPKQEPGRESPSLFHLLHVYSCIFSMFCTRSPTSPTEGGAAWRGHLPLRWFQNQIAWPPPLIRQLPHNRASYPLGRCCWSSPNRRVTCLHRPSRWLAELPAQHRHCSLVSTAAGRAPVRSLATCNQHPSPSAAHTKKSSHIQPLVELHAAGCDALMPCWIRERNERIGRRNKSTEERCGNREEEKYPCYL
jgi:hypothetical protein